MEPALDSTQLVRLLASDDRRKVVAALVLIDAAASPTAIAQRADLSLRTVVDSLDRLVTGGLVIDEAGDFVLNSDAFQRAARAEAPARPPSQHGDQPDDIARVLDAAIKDGKLVQWPAKHSKRLIVLDHMVQVFDIGKRYSEPEVNERLRPFSDDVAMSRRYLVDERFLDRSGGEYWRCGGSV